jgi:hypothetical protein
MSRESIYEAAKLPSSKRDEISAVLLAALLLAYGASIRAHLTVYGYGDRELTIADEDVVSKLSKRANEQALTIIVFTNQLLKRAIDALSADLTDEQIVSELEDFWSKAKFYNAQSLAPMMTRWAAAQATLDFVQANVGDQDVQWECSPGYTDSTDEMCDCPAAIDASPMSFDEAQGFDMPNHPNCIHAMTPIITTDVRWPADPWTGEASGAAEEAA